MPYVRKNNCDFSDILHSKVFLLGEKGSGVHAKSEIQDYSQIRDTLLKQGSLFEDPDFPLDEDIIWKRPNEIVENPKFISDGISRSDVKQGHIGDCWFLSSLACLASARQEIFQRVVPTDQSFSENYAGIFHFRFWSYGRWIDVVIDDRLATNQSGQLNYVQSTDNNEFWSALVEKAYTKLFANATYGHMNGGIPSEAMAAFTGGMGEFYDLASVPSNMFQILRNSEQHGSLISTCTLASLGMQTITNEGLVGMHAYSITKTAVILYNDQNLALVRLRNPWASTEWKGAWSDKSHEWNCISVDQREELGLTVQDDGEFWMSYADLKSRFKSIYICHINPNVYNEKNVKSDKLYWKANIYEGKLSQPLKKDNMYLNPQYTVTVTNTDCRENGECTILANVIQKRSNFRRHVRKNVIRIALYDMCGSKIYTVPLAKEFFLNNEAKYMPFGNADVEFTTRFSVSPGTYCLIPFCTTLEPTGCEFLLRVYTECESNMKEFCPPIGVRKNFGFRDAINLKVNLLKWSTKNREMIKGNINRINKLHIKDMQGNCDEDQNGNMMNKSNFFGFNLDSQLLTSGNILNTYKEEMDSGRNKQINPDYECGATPFVFEENNDIKDSEADITDADVLEASASLKLLWLQIGVDLDVLENEGIEAKNYFLEVAGGEIGWFGLKKILDKFLHYDGKIKCNGFNREICRTMVSVMDVDDSNKMGYSEFTKLWNELTILKLVFHYYDTKKLGILSENIVKEAIKCAGYNINGKLFMLIINRYGNDQAEVQFDDFVMICMRLKTMIDVFKVNEVMTTNSVSCNLKKWMEALINV